MSEFNGTRTAFPKVATAHLVTQAGMGLALAVGLPVVLHPIGLGPAFLPMHLPVLLTGALAGATAGALAGMLAPALSYLLTGLPPVVPPVAPLMTFELATYGLVAGALRALVGRWRLPGRASGLGMLGLEYLWLIAALIAGRLALGLAAALLGPQLGLRVPALTYLQAAVLTGLPGIIVQLALVPAIVTRIRPIVGRHRRTG
jgi:hypothetical protein